MADPVIELSAYWSRPVDEILATLKTGWGGLSTSAAQERLKSYGANTLKVRKHVATWALLLKQFRSPLVLILVFAAVISASVNDWVDTAVILAIVLGSALITFAQEYRAGNAVKELQSRLTHNVVALRDGRAAIAGSESIVPGDVVLLSAGTLIPADGLVLEAKDFFVDQAVLTGETFPVERVPALSRVAANLAERGNCVFMGTSVRSGTARVLIVQTGTSTAYGQIANRLRLRPPETEFERGIRSFGYMLTRIMAVLVLTVFAMNVISARPAVDSLLFAIALAVGISPELLPAIITITLSKGAREMARHGVIVRQLSAIENLGSMDVLCTDKTGTLTEGSVQLSSAIGPYGEPSEAVLRYAFLNAHFQTGLSNPLDNAIASYRQFDLNAITKVDEVPYDFVRKRLSTVVREGDKAPVLITKGAFDNVLAVCSHINDGNDLISIDSVQRERIRQPFIQAGDQGLRVLGVAIKSVALQSAYTRADECNLTFIGFLLFFDPPKPEVGGAISQLDRLGVRLKVITGDNRRVAKHLADMIGIRAEGMLTGEELNNLHDEALWHLVEHTSLFVEVDPSQKERIIRALKKMGHVVGYMGDGINDAPALHDADVGISVDGAVDVAREAANIVLLQRDLDVLRRGIEEGRLTFANSLKYIFTTTSANFGNMFSMAGASFFLPFLPLLAKQILLNNFLSDFPAIAIAGDNVDRELVSSPHRWDVKFIRNFMIIFGLISSAFDFVTFAVLLFVIHATPGQFRTGWFVESLMTELFVALVVRTPRPLYKSRPGRWLWISTLLIAVLTVIIPYLPFSDVLGFVPLSFDTMALLLVITLLYVIATEAAKRALSARSGTELFSRIGS